MNTASVRRFIGVALLASLLTTLSLATSRKVAQQPAAAPVARTDQERQDYRKAMETADQKIADEVKAHSELMKNLEYLTTNIGPRLTGSPQMQAASQWTLQRFRDYGIDAHLETTQIAHAWTRGQDTAAILSPISRAVPIRSFGWGKATPGAVTGTVRVLEVKTLADFDKYKGQLKGAVVLAGKPATLRPENQPADNAYDAVIPPPQGVPRPRMSFRERLQLLKMIAAEQPAVVLLDSGKWDNLFNMAGGYNKYQPSDVPMGFISHEDYDLIYRLQQSGPVTLKVSLNGTFSAGPVPASITVAEIKGTEFPEQRVIIGGHLDSWDLGQGALDNGTGAMAVLEAARTLKALGWQPKRTLTFILFTGEEQGGIGAETFLENHASEVPKMDAVLIHDTGTGRVFSIALEDEWETAPLMTEIYRPLEEVFELQPLSTRLFGASDHVPFMKAGVPGYFCVQMPAHYGQAHHSQADTFDKVIPDQINEGAALLAAWAWNVSQMLRALPHHPASTSNNMF
ncbi:MAG: M20/M25/M40 family metallo-hydrolase [Chlamydiota bacterium]